MAIKLFIIIIIIIFCICRCYELMFVALQKIIYYYCYVQYRSTAQKDIITN